MTDWLPPVDEPGGKVDRRRGTWGCVTAAVVGACFVLLLYAAFAAVTIYLWRTL